MDALRIDPQPQFALSPYLYMQFMEPLGTTDSSVEAAWDFQQQDWRQDVVQVTRELAPTLIRWGGCLSSYYLWQEGVGPRDQRQPMPNPAAAKDLAGHRVTAIVGVTCEMIRLDHHLPVGHDGQISHRNKPRLRLLHVANRIDGDSYCGNVAIGALKLDLEIRSAFDLDGVTVVAGFQRSDEG